MSLKLHLGCGNKIWPGFVNIDQFDDAADEHYDITNLPYENGTVDEIHLIHVIEHLNPQHVQGIIKGWFRILKPGGMIAIECPSWNKVIKFCYEGSPDLRLTKLALYGDITQGPGMSHYWCYGSGELGELLNRAGFIDAALSPVKFHMPERDMRITAFKPA